MSRDNNKEDNLIITSSGGLSINELRGFVNSLPRSMDDYKVNFKSFSDDFLNEANAAMIKDSTLLIED